VLCGGLHAGDLCALGVLEVLVDLELVDPQVVALHGAGQRGAVAVGDVTAQGGDGAGDGALGDRLLGTGAGVQALHPDQASGQRQDGHQDDADEQAVPGGGVTDPGRRDEGPAGAAGPGPPAASRGAGGGPTAAAR